MHKKKLWTLALGLLFVLQALAGVFFLVKFNQETGQQQQHLTQLQQQVGQLSQHTQTLLERQRETPSQQTISAEVIAHARHASVIVHTSVSESAYYRIGSFQGSGVVVDKAKGLILTNAHVVGGNGSVASYQLEFADGTCVSAQLIYCDPWVDYAFLQCDPARLPLATEQVTLSARSPEQGEPVLLLGNNAAEGLDAYTGTVSQTCLVVEPKNAQRDSLPISMFSFKMKVYGGASGAGLFDAQGNLLGLSTAASKLHGQALDLDYIRYALPFVRQGKQPIRKHVGLVARLLPLELLAPHLGMSAEQVSAYKKEQQLSTAQVLVVGQLLKGSPAEGLLELGDLIERVDGKAVGTSLALLDRYLSEAAGPQVSLQLYRKGNRLTVQLPLYTLRGITRMVRFAGALWFEADDTWANELGVPRGTLTFRHIAPGSSLGSSPLFPHHTFYGSITHVEGKPISTLEALVALIPQLQRQGHFTLHYLSYGKVQRVAGISYKQQAQEPAKLLVRDAQGRWKEQPIAVH